MTRANIGQRVIDVSELVDVFEAQEGEIQQIIGKTGNGKTYEGTRRALRYLRQGYVVYTTWKLILPDYFDERESPAHLVVNLLLFWRKRFYAFDYRKNWYWLDIDRPDLVEFVANLTDCVVFLDEGQDIFDSYEGRGMKQIKRRTLTRTRHLHKTLIIISQRAQAVAVTARANVTFFYKCVKTRVWFWPFKIYFKIYITEEMDEQNFPIWEERLPNGDMWTAPVWHGGFASLQVYDAYNSWYLRAGIEKSQHVGFEAYDLTYGERLRALGKAIMTKKKRIEPDERQKKFLSEPLAKLEPGGKKKAPPTPAITTDVPLLIAAAKLPSPPVDEQRLVRKLVVVDSSNGTTPQKAKRSRKSREPVALGGNGGNDRRDAPPIDERKRLRLGLQPESPEEATQKEQVV